MGSAILARMEDARDQHCIRNDPVADLISALPKPDHQAAVPGRAWTAKTRELSDVAESVLQDSHRPIGHLRAHLDKEGEEAIPIRKRARGKPNRKQGSALVPGANRLLQPLHPLVGLKELAGLLVLGGPAEVLRPVVLKRKVKNLHSERSNVHSGRLCGLPQAAGPILIEMDVEAVGHLERLRRVS